MAYKEKILGEIELHSVEGIKECFRNGVAQMITSITIPLTTPCAYLRK